MADLTPTIATLAFAALACGGLSLERHHRQIHHRPATIAHRRALRVAMTAGLVVVATLGATQGGVRLVEAVLATCLAGGAVAGLITVRPRLLPSAILIALAAALVLAIPSS